MAFPINNVIFIKIILNCEVIKPLPTLSLFAINCTKFYFICPVVLEEFKCMHGMYACMYPSVFKSVPFYMACDMVMR